MKENVLDLFCGAGGLSLGFKLAGYNIVGGIDFSKEAIETYKHNFKSAKCFCGDISQITNEKIIETYGNKVDIIIGGPPCQGFSSANKWQKNEFDERNLLFKEYLRFVEVLKPRVFVLENVKGILTKNNGYVKKEMEKAMEKLGYKLCNKVLNASDYGVPQARERNFFVGIRNDLNIDFDFDKLTKMPRVTVGEAIGDLYSYEKTEKVISKKYKQDYLKIMKKHSNNVIYNHNPKYPNDKVINRIQYVPEGGNWKDVPEELWETHRDNRHSSAYKRLNSSDVSITIDTGHMNYFHPFYNRVPTVRESARIQSFTDDFEFLGNQGSQYKQVGNAVPPLLAMALAKAIKKQVGGNND